MRAFIQTGLCVTSLGLLLTCTTAVAQALPKDQTILSREQTGLPHGVYDLWIRNGIVVDGTGTPRFEADVLVNGDTIAYVGKVANGSISARQTIDARDEVVAPGFIDAHAHGDPLAQSFLNFLSQGITTVSPAWSKF